MQKTNSLWQATAADIAELPRLQRDIRTKVVIIGAGYTGLSAALRLSEHDIPTCVIEAKSVGHGGSGRNVGLVNAGLWTPPDLVEKKLGQADGGRLNALLAAGPQRVFDLIEKHHIDCDAVRKGTLHCAQCASGVHDLAERARQQVARGAPVLLLDALETSVRTGAQGLHGALFDQRAGTIQPLSYARGLATAALKAGAQIYQNSPADSVTYSSGLWYVDTPSGRVSAPHLIQATNAYRLGENEKNRFLTMYYMQLATQHLNTDQSEKILPGGEGCWDTASVMTSFRLNSERRLLIGAIGNLDGFGGRIHRNWAKRKMVSLFPHLAAVNFEFGWTGRVAVSDTYLPKIVNLGPKALSIFGYSGRGISPGTVFGQAAADWIISDGDSPLPVPQNTAKSNSATGPKEKCFELGSVLTHAIDAR